MIIAIRVKVTLFFDLDQELSLAGVGDQFVRRPDVAFAIRRVFQQLPELIAIAFNGLYGRGGLDDQHPKGTCLKLEFINDGCRNSNVMTLADIQLSKLVS